MKPVKYNGSIGKIGFNAFDKCRGHVARNLLDVIGLASMGNKITYESMNNRMVLAFGNKNGPFFFNINE